MSKFSLFLCHMPFDVQFVLCQQQAQKRQVESRQAKAYARGLGLNPPLELDILQKLYYLSKGD